MNRRIGKVGLALVLALILVVAMEFFGGEVLAQTKVKKLKVAITQDLSGPLASIGRHGMNGFKDYFEWLNTMKGGIDGVEVEVLWADDKYNMAMAMESYKRFAEQGALSFCISSSVLLVQLKETAERDKVVIVGWCENDYAVYPPGWSWGTTPAYGDTTSCLIDWIMKNRWNKPRPPKITILGMDSDFGHSPEKLAFPYLKAKWGVQFGKFQVVAPNAVDATKQLLAAKEEGTDIILEFNSPPGAVTVAKDRQKLGLQDIVMCSPWGTPATDPRFQQQVGEAAEGYLSTYTFAVPWNPAMKLPGMGMETCVEFQKKKRSEVSDTPFYYVAWVTGHALAEGMRSALKEKEYPITGVDLYQALQKLDVDGMGIVKRLKPAPGRRAFSQITMITEIKGGKHVPMGDWVEVPDTVGWALMNQPDLLKKK